MHPNRRSHHSRALTKDYILQSYIPIFFNALKKRCQAIIYLDPFAGPGRYEDDSAGSPIHVLEVARGLNKLISDPYFIERLFFVFVEHDDAHFKRLQESTKPYRQEGFNIICIQADARNVIKEVSDLIYKEIQNPSKIALFVYLDPWGLKGIDKDIVFEVLKLRGFAVPSEVLLRFPPYLVCRFYRNSYMGPDWIQNLLGIPPDSLEQIISEIETKEERHEEILKKYARNTIRILRNGFGIDSSCCAVETVGGGLPYYMLFFSESPAGVSHMSDVMVKAFLKRQLEILKEEQPLLIKKYFQPRKRGEETIEIFQYQKAVKDFKNVWPKYLVLEEDLKSLAPFETREELLYRLLKKRVLAIAHSAVKEALEKLGLTLGKRKGLFCPIVRG